MGAGMVRRQPDHGAHSTAAVSGRPDAVYPGLTYEGTRDNGAADALSRNDIVRFRRLRPNAADRPAALPACLAAYLSEPIHSAHLLTGCRMGRRGRMRVSIRSSMVTFLSEHVQPRICILAIYVTFCPVGVFGGMREPPR